MEMSPPWLLFSQHTVLAELRRDSRDVRSVSIDGTLAQQVGYGTHQELPDPTPMTDMGEQVSPTSTSGPKTRPSSPRMRLATGLLALTTWSQHWTGPVEQDWGGFPEGFDLFAAVEQGVSQYAAICEAFGDCGTVGTARADDRPQGSRFNTVPTRAYMLRATRQAGVTGYGERGGTQLHVPATPVGGSLR